MKVTRKKLVELLHVLLNIDDIEIIKCDRRRRKNNTITYSIENTKLI